jgi:hypothetical protein
MLSVTNTGVPTAVHGYWASVVPSGQTKPVILEATTLPPDGVTIRDETGKQLMTIRREDMLYE